jgi:hypothetical protein
MGIARFVISVVVPLALLPACGSGSEAKIAPPAIQPLRIEARKHDGAYALFLPDTLTPATTIFGMR